MDLKQIRTITKFARRNGIKSLKFEGFEIEFGDLVVPPKAKRLKVIEEDAPPVQEVRELTLEQINDYIYGTNQEIQ